MMNRAITQASAVAVTGLLAAAIAVVLAASFIPWGNHYEAIYFQAVETSRTARYPQGFIATGVVEGAALVLMTAAALLAVAGVAAYGRVQTMRFRTLGFSVVAALLAGTVLPATVLYGFLAVVPAIAACTAAVLALRTRSA